MAGVSQSGGGIGGTPLRAPEKSSKCVAHSAAVPGLGESRPQIHAAALLPSCPPGGALMAAAMACAERESFAAWSCASREASASVCGECALMPAGVRPECAAAPIEGSGERGW
jgi:hypothetical protein